MVSLVVAYFCLGWSEVSAVDMLRSRDCVEAQNWHD
jgi:hypothetical protein